MVGSSKFSTFIERLQQSNARARSLLTHDSEQHCDRHSTTTESSRDEDPGASCSCPDDDSLSREPAEGNTTDARSFPFHVFPQHMRVRVPFFVRVTLHGWTTDRPLLCGRQEGKWRDQLPRLYSLLLPLGPSERVLYLDDFKSSLPGTPRGRLKALEYPRSMELITRDHRDGCRSDLPRPPRACQPRARAADCGE